MSWRRFTRFMGNKPKFIGGPDGVVIQPKKPNPVPKKVKKYVTRKLDAMIEDKVIRVNQPSATAVGAVTSYVLLNGMIRGLDEGQRIAHRIRTKWVRLNISVIIDPAGLAAATTGYFFRYILLYDKQPNGSLPSNAQLLYNVTAGETYESPLNIDGEKRYKILTDKTIPVNVTGGSSNASSMIAIRRKIKLKNKLTVYNTSNVGTEADINTGAIYLVMMCDAFILATYHTELRYEDA